MNLVSSVTIGLVEQSRLDTATDANTIKQLQVPTKVGFSSWEIAQMFRAQEAERIRLKKEEEKEKEEKGKALKELGQQRKKEEEERKAKVMEKAVEKSIYQQERRCRVCGKEHKGPTNAWKGCDSCEFWVCGVCLAMAPTVIEAHSKGAHRQTKNSKKRPQILQPNTPVDETAVVEEAEVELPKKIPKKMNTGAKSNK